MLLDRYNEAIIGLLEKVRVKERENIIKAGEMIACAVAEGACVHVYDTGHIIDCELINRGGGLILYKWFKYGLNVDNPVRKRDRSDLDTSMAGLAAYALKASGARPGDVMILGSVSGRSVAVVDLALEAKKFGLKTIAITSMEYTTQIQSEHPCGKRLFELADLVLDNCAPAAEAMIDVEGLDARFAAASGLSAASILWSITAVVIESLMGKGIVPGVFKSVNFPGGKEHLQELSERYEKLGW